jgi:hypothetical protein
MSVGTLSKLILENAFKTLSVCLWERFQNLNMSMLLRPDCVSVGTLSELEREYAVKALSVSLWEHFQNI